ncbi:Glucose-repressible protein [Penicillium cataractarum]|uniref:Glucose-repressible protein n=1 Tax=Penicillium cataractarum TaxID=2100454 RepID=A0A9W9SKP1_9EURO|nr:Glucose-repressible protein [Penicillium cataractarum]KAJ5380257.1 Glucose-repressible protein [Penicillium cataractarum]
MKMVKNAAKYVSESVKGSTSETAKEANKNIAKDSDACIGTRATAAKDVAIDKKDEFVQEVKADTHNEAAKHQVFHFTDGPKTYEGYTSTNIVNII